MNAAFEPSGPKSNADAAVPSLSGRSNVLVRTTAAMEGSESDQSLRRMQSPLVAGIGSGFALASLRQVS
jgi:hypothetical protein